MKPQHKIPRRRHLRQPHQQRSRHTCPLSDSVKPHKLIRRQDHDHAFSACFACKDKYLEIKRYYYYCSTCDLEFHRGCHVLPLKLKHPLHLSHPLTLTYLDSNRDASKIPHEWRESASDSEVSDYDYLSNNDGDYHDDDASPTYTYHEKCKCCKRPFEDLYYCCSICNFNLNFSCTINPPPHTISHLKSHNHSLTLFPRRIPLPCDACGLSLNNIHDVVYACLPCNYMVHRSCIGLPRVIKITRHQHRLSLISSLPSGKFSCGVCRQTIDVGYGHYNCNKECHYSVHSKCATRKDVWDGKDLEEVPEKPEKDIESFMRIDMETIKHITHEHYLKLQSKCNILGEKNFCEACCFPILNSDVIYSCMPCNFVLHEACTSLPRVKHHPLHKHPLILHQSLSHPYWFWGNDVAKGMFQCHGCARKCSGFVYSCSQKDCTFLLDVRCASILDISIHESHPHDDHPLFINLTKGECMGCKSSTCSDSYLECMRCKSYLGLHCATLPSVAHYKHDRHPLTLSYGEKGTISGHYWCELCELQLDASEWFYTCDSCRVTLHVICLLGIDMYMKPQHIIRIGGVEVEISRTNGSTRPFCYECRGRCMNMLVFKCQHEYVCSLHCIENFLNRCTEKRSKVHEIFFPIDKIRVDSKLLQIEHMLNKQPLGIRSIGIWGMAGIGKTTIAKAIFMKMQKDYTSSCFIQNFEKQFQEKGFYRLREQQLSFNVREKLDINKLIINETQQETFFLILDDVHESINAEAFLGGFEWFDPGSLIIITSMDHNVLRQCRVNDIYEVKGLDEVESLKLFSDLAFGEKLLNKDHLKISEMVIKYANGNAKALSHYGKELKGKSLEAMEEMFFQLKRWPPTEILELLKSSYDEFSDDEKIIFLDIACFFRGELVEHVMQALKWCGFVGIGLKYLFDKSLVFVSENRLEMHNLIHDVAWMIQNQEVRNGKNRRLCDIHIIQPLLEDEETNENGKHIMELENIETMLLDASGLSFLVDPEAFQSMCHLRLLKIYSSDHERPPQLDLQKGLVSLPFELQILHWEYYLFQTLPKDYDPHVLVELIMPYSQIVEIWTEIKSLMSLKTIDLHDSRELVTIYEVSEAFNLHLINLQGCTSLEKFPDIAHLGHLKVLNLCGCLKIKIFPEVPPSIEELSFNGTDIREIPSSIETLSKLVKLDLGNCRKLRNFLIKIYNMESLKWLNLSGCIMLESFPQIAKRMENLQYLYLSCTAIPELHTSIARIISLNVLEVRETIYLPYSLANLRDLRIVRTDEKHSPLTLNNVEDHQSAMA